jgi:hypothetical protein
VSVEQRVKISCDKFECDVTIHSGVGLTDARAMSSAAGWVNTIHYEGGTIRRPILQDFCPDHRDTAFEWSTWRAEELSRKATTEGASE